MALQRSSATSLPSWPLAIQKAAIDQRQLRPGSSLDLREPVREHRNAW